MSSLASSTPAPPPRDCSSSSSPSSPLAWTRLSDRPPGLKTYCSRGSLRLTIKHESGSRKVFCNSCDQPQKRDHMGQLTNGAPRRLRQDCEVPNGTLTCHSADEDVLQTVLGSEIKSPPLPSPPPSPPNAGSWVRGVESLQKDTEALRVKSFRLDVSPLPLQEDNVLSDHLQSAIDSILELQRLQGTSTGAAEATQGLSLDPAVTSMLEGHLWDNARRWRRGNNVLIRSCWPLISVVVLFFTFE